MSGAQLALFNENRERRSTRAREKMSGARECRSLQPLTHVPKSLPKNQRPNVGFKNFAKILCVEIFPQISALVKK